MIRQFCLKLHRWFGLTSALFLIIVSLTGSMIAFNEELEYWLSPQLFVVESANIAVLDPLVLFDIVSRKLPSGYQLLDLPLLIEPGKSVQFAAATGAEEHLSPLQIFVNPQTGNILGQRIWGEVSFDKKNLMPLINRIHFSLALDSIGSYLLGIIAIFWTLDCFVGFYLTLPKTHTTQNITISNKKSWLQRWRGAWCIKLNGSFIRLNYDLHIALSLWLWLALFMFAWSSVAFNLPKEVYNPVTEFIFGMEQNQEYMENSPNNSGSKLSWPDALKIARELMTKQAMENNFQVVREDTLSYDPMLNTYQYLVKSSLDSSKWATTKIIFAADSGTFIKAVWPGIHEKLGDVITRWLIWLHMAVVFGISMQIFVCFLGLVITMLSITGIYIWWRKKQVVILSRRHRQKPIDHNGV